MSLSPTQRTLRELRQQGRVCGIVERWIPRPGRAHGVRVDLFGIIDIIALDPERGVVGVQSCGQAFAEHERKFFEERAQECIDWLATPGTVLELWGWRKVKVKRGGKAMVWRPRIRTFTLQDFGVGGKITHGRHCSCSACAREDWTRLELAPCGMHGFGCPPVYAPLGAPGDFERAPPA